jgi:putative PIN family toxin of toxin-antitoxin system
MRVVIDTNVFISSFLGGKPRAIIEEWKKGRLQWCLSAALLEEYMEVLRRLGFQKRSDVKKLLHLFRRGSHILFTRRTPTYKIVREDSDDDKVLECARALRAKAIITGDKVLLRYDPWRGIRIQTPEQFLSKFVYAGKLPS